MCSISDPEPATAPDSPHLRFVMPSDPMAVRNTLKGLFAELDERDLMTCDRADAEIVLAEVLNNVVEHAYGEGPGVVELEVQPLPQGLRCLVVDRGASMPGGVIPDSHPAIPPEDGVLPEGGFGWFLIRTLASEMTYCRVSGKNQLSFFLLGNNFRQTGATVAPN